MQIGQRSIRRGRTKPGKSCLRSSPEEQKSVEFSSAASEPTSLSTDLQLAHWIEGFHDPDGTHTSLIVSSENDQHEDSARRAIHEADGTWSATALDGSQSARSQAAECYLHTGDNTGAELLVEHTTVLITREGRTSCVDDVSGEVLDEAGVRAARVLEMELFRKMGVYEQATGSGPHRQGQDNQGQMAGRQQGRGHQPRLQITLRGQGAGVQHGRCL